MKNKKMIAVATAGQHRGLRQLVRQTQQSKRCARQMPLHVKRYTRPLNLLLKRQRLTTRQSLLRIRQTKPRPLRRLHVRLRLSQLALRNSPPCRQLIQTGCHTQRANTRPQRQRQVVNTHPNPKSAPRIFEGHFSCLTKISQEWNLDP